eukprot:1176006-Prorocentrum_minimum.AAC.1
MKGTAEGRMCFWLAHKSAQRVISLRSTSFVGETINIGGSRVEIPCAVRGLWEGCGCDGGGGEGDSVWDRLAASRGDVGVGSAQRWLRGER